MKKDNDNAKEKHAKSNSKHQKAVALRTQWLKDNPDKKKEDIIQAKSVLPKASFQKRKRAFLRRPMLCL